MRGFSHSSRDNSSTSSNKSARAKRGLKTDILRRATSSAVELLEGRVLLSTATSDGFVATFYGAYFNTQAQFPVPATTAPISGYPFTSGDYSTHIDVINNAAGNNQNVPPADAPSNFNPNPGGGTGNSIGDGTGGPGDRFSGDFATNLKIITPGYFTFYPATDDGAEIVVANTPVGAQNLGAGRGTAQDTDIDTNQLAPASGNNPDGSYSFDFLYNNGGGGWNYELRWSATSGPNGTGTQLIPFSLMTGAGAPGIANLEAPAPLVSTTTPTVVTKTGTTVTLSWSSHDVDAASYIVQRSSDLGNTFTDVNDASPVASADGGTDTFTDGGLTPNTQYVYQIISNSIIGATTPGVAAEPISSGEALVKTTATAATISAPVISVAPSSAGNVLTIAPVANAAAYNILTSSTVGGTYSQVASIIPSGTSPNTTYTDAGNNAATFYEVQATDGGSVTATSGPVTLGKGDGFGASYYASNFDPNYNNAGSPTFSTGTTFNPDVTDPNTGNTPVAAPTYSTIIPTINSGPQTITTPPPYTPTSFNSGQSAGAGANFSTEFDFTVVAPTTETYTFLARADDGYQLTVDNTVIGVKSSSTVSTTAVPVPVQWTAGSTHTVQLAYFQAVTGWEMDLGWTSPSIAALNAGGFYGSNGQVIPTYDAFALGTAPSTAVNTPQTADAPVASTGVFNSNNININWTSSEADSYNVYRGTSMGGELPTPYATVTGSPNSTTGVATYTYEDTAANPGSTYYYIVKAVNATGIGTASNEVSYLPTAAAPIPVTGVSTVVTATNPIYYIPQTLGATALPLRAPTIQVSWNASPAVYNVSGYDVLRATVVNGVAGTFSAVATGLTSTTYSDTTTAANTNYQYEIVARNVADPSGAAPSSTSAPANALYAGDGVMEQYYINSTNWGGATDNGDTAISGIVGLPTESSEQPTINFNNTNQNVFPPGGTQGFTYSTIFTGKVKIATAGNYTFFSDTDDDGLLYLDGQKLTAGNAGGRQTSPVLALNPGSYDYQFFMEQGGGGHRFIFSYAGPDTGNAITVVPTSALTAYTGAPLAATNVVATLAGTSVNVTFTDNSDNEFEYQLQRSTSPTFASNVTVAATTGTVVNGAPVSGGAITSVTSTLTDSNLLPNQTFYYRLVGLNFEGSTPSVVSNSVTVGTIAPAAPTNAVATVGGFFSTPTTLGGPAITTFGNKITWTTSTLATSYDILRAPVTGGSAGTFATVATGVTGSPYVDQAPIGGQYQYEVVARNSVDPTGSAPTSTSTPTATVMNNEGVLEQFYANNTNWGGASDNGATTITGVVGAPTTTTQQLQVNYNALPDSTLPPGGNYLPADNYSTIWTGKVTIAQTGAYTFFKNTDDDGILYVDGALVAAGAYSASNINNGTILQLTGGQSYDFQLFQEQGGGGHGSQILYSGPDTANATVVVPATALIPLTGAPLAATNVVPTLGTAANANFGFPVTVTFSDNADNELAYILQRSTDPTFATGVQNVAGSGAVINGVPQASGAPTVTTGTLVDSNAPTGATVYYRVVAENFNGATASVATAAVTVPGTATTGGIEVNYYANEWWQSTNQSTTATVIGGPGSKINSLSLQGTAAETTIIPNINELGGGDNTTTDSGNIATNPTTPFHPDPGNIIPPDDFSDVMTGQIDITDISAPYTFATNSDDDSYLYVDDQLVSAYPGGHGPGNGESTTPITFTTAGEHNIEYFQTNGGGGWAWQMLYNGPDSAALGAGLQVVPSSVLTSTMSPLSTPGQPTTTAVPPTLNTITVNYPENNTSAVRYVLQRSTDAAFDSAGNVTTIGLGLSGLTPATYTGTRSYTDTGLAINTTYYYRVEAQNFEGSSTFSAVGSGTTLNQLPPTPVTADEDVNGKVQVGFPAVNNPSVSGYSVQTIVNGTPTGSPVIVAAGTTTYTDSTAYAFGTNLQYQVTVESSTPATVANSTTTTSNTVLYVASRNNINHPTGFAGENDLTLNTGSGSPFSPVINTANYPNGALQLTSSSFGNTATSAFNTTAFAINSDFSTSFDFQFNQPAADGFAFVIQGNGNNLVGPGGGDFGYANNGTTALSPFTNSLGIAFNMYNGVTQVGLLENGGNPTLTNMTSLGNAFHNLNASNYTDVFQAQISLDASTDSTTGAVLHLVVRDTTTGLGYTQDFTLPANALASNSGLYGPSSQDYVGFTGGTGGAAASQVVTDWTFTTLDTTPHVTGLSPSSEPYSSNLGADDYAPITITGSNFNNVTQIQFGSITVGPNTAGQGNPPNGFVVNSPTSITVTPTDQLNPGTYDVIVTANNQTSAIVAADKFTYSNGVVAPTIVGNPVINGDVSTLAGVQRSMVQDVVYTFSSAVTIANANAAFTVTATGAHPGTAPTTLSATAVAGSNGTQWAVTLTGGAPGALGSIANGEYSITINPSFVLSAADGTTPLAAGRTDNFFRLYGDINGDESVNAGDNLKFK
ncbi:MAG TPA: PA14 domain-containing protein, partial [Tepidisphaeraceae bacterium]|nr:PA14 domain-containing protein [Tepidisphaeraceae bacterium]